MHFVSHISQIIILFIFADVYTVQEGSHNISIFQTFFYKIFEKFNDDLYLWKSEVIPIKKRKIFNNSLNIEHFSKKFLTEPYTYLYNTLHKSRDFLISSFESGNIFQKMWLLGKFTIMSVWELIPPIKPQPNNFLCFLKHWQKALIIPIFSTCLTVTAYKPS